MTNKKQWTMALLAGLVIVLTIASWALFAPPQMGGLSTLVIVNGNSMEPLFHSGDLVIVRNADYYQVGDVVAYKNMQMGKYVIHRIIAEEFGHFVLQGDNNTWTDGYEPASDEIIGKQWLHIPFIGKAMSWFRKPVYFSLSVCLMGGLLMISRLKERSQQLRRKMKLTPSRQRWLTPQRIGQSGEIIFLIFSIVLLSSLIFGLIAFMRPVTKTIPEDISYKHTGKFDYSAPAPSGVYDSNTIQSGQPIFLKLNCDVRIDYGYAFSAESFQNIHGTQAINAVISDSNGWKRTLTLQPETGFTGSEYSTSSKLDLCEVNSLVKTMQEKTGLQHSEYTLSIMPITNIEGKIEGVDFSDIYAPTLDFRFNDISFWLANTNAVAEEPVNPLYPYSERTLKNWVEVPNTISFLGMKLPVSGVRVFATIFFLISAGGFSYLFATTSKMSKASKDADVRLRYSSMLVEVQNNIIEPNLPIIDVAAIQDLARLAERNSSMIFHYLNENGIHTYLVHNENSVYRVMLPERETTADEIGLESKRKELKHALDSGQFILHYQPVIDLNKQQIVGMEALMRWNHPTLGTLPPSAFIPDAEATGLISIIGEWVIRTACKQLREWEDAGIPQLSLAINISSRQSLYVLPNLIKHITKEYRIEPAQIQLEFSELQIMENLESTLKPLDALRKLGVAISIDNYTGKVSMAQLARIKARNLKFAMAFISQLKNPEMIAVALSTIAAAQELGMLVDAVGVETEEQLQYLRTQPVSCAQGFYFGKPVAADEALQTLFGAGRRSVIIDGAA
ncbi:MAG: signal peptidase I [Anaerolineaceae bacterium]